MAPRLALVGLHLLRGAAITASSPGHRPSTLFLRDLSLLISHGPRLHAKAEAPYVISVVRSFSSSAHRPNRPRVDIGARARQLQNRRLWTYGITFSCIAGFVAVVLNNFQEQLVFYITPTDALEKFAADPSKSRYRLGGLVLEGSVSQPASSPFMEFVITDLITDILVRYQGPLPDLFREGHSVVVEGFLKPLDEEIRRVSGSKPVAEKARIGRCYFSALEVLAKHDEKYMPQEVAQAIEKNRKMLESGEAISQTGSAG